MSVRLKSLQDDNSLPRWIRTNNRNRTITRTDYYCWVRSQFNWLEMTIFRLVRRKKSVHWMVLPAPQLMKWYNALDSAFIKIPYVILMLITNGVMNEYFIGLALNPILSRQRGNFNDSQPLTLHWNTRSRILCGHIELNKQQICVFGLISFFVFGFVNRISSIRRNRILRLVNNTISTNYSMDCYCFFLHYSLCDSMRAVCVCVWTHCTKASWNLCAKIK